MKDLLFYTIDKEYISFLSKFDNHVSFNKDYTGHSRPYLGIILEIYKYKYFAPLYSYKEHYKKYNNNPSFFIVYDKRSNPISIIKFSAMIPVINTNNVVKLLEFDKQDKKYKDLISVEYRYINSNKKEIYKRAERMYRLVTNKNRNFLKIIACDFKLLEQKTILYRRKNNR